MNSRSAVAALVACAASLAVGVSLGVAKAESGPGPGGKVVRAKGGATPPKAIVAATPGCAGSAWIADSNATNHTTAIPNPAGSSPPSSLTVYFSPGGDPSAAVFPVAWSWDNHLSGNPVTIEVTANRISLQIFSQSPLHGVWSAATGVWTTYASGYWAAVACK
jgi:hypothetical protein